MTHRLRGLQWRRLPESSVRRPQGQMVLIYVTDIIAIILLSCSQPLAVPESPEVWVKV